MNDDLHMIRNSSKWPCWPFLPLKRKDNTLENKNLGVLCDDGKSLTIYHVYVCDPSMDLKGCEKTTYESHQQMLADGWKVD